ncbi:hypothetical protein FIM64_00425 [Helicobacter pylori]|nr:hypothetical protein FIM64_00425 [Helicobacter pylori]
MVMINRNGKAQKHPNKALKDNNPFECCGLQINIFISHHLYYQSATFISHYLCITLPLAQHLIRLL